MSIRSRIFAGIFVVVAIGFYFLVDWIAEDLTPQYRESTEEPLVDASRVLASLAATTAENGKIDVELFRRAFQDVYAKSFEAQIFNFKKTSVDFRVYITDTDGTVVFDSDNGRDEGRDYSEWRDVHFTLAGRYGARTSRDLPGDMVSSVLYVAAPIETDHGVIGVLTVGKPTRNANLFIEAARHKITVGGLVTALAVIAFGLLISGMITRPVERLTEYARDIRDGKRPARPSLGASEVGELGEAFEEMRDALEGKQYVEQYVQTLTHEIKSPLSAIRGAVELLSEEMPLEDRRRFLQNIKTETERIKTLVDKLLLLSSLEARKGKLESVSLHLSTLVGEEIDRSQPYASSRSMTFQYAADSENTIQGEELLIRTAIQNVLKNAIEFGPPGSVIEVDVKTRGQMVEILVHDCGQGIPDYAHEKVFNRFYSLKRPDTGKKSSGLGLSLVKEIVELHGGACHIQNHPEGGCEVGLLFPVRMRSS